MVYLDMMDYCGSKREIGAIDTNDIDFIMVDVISGDERILIFNGQSLIGFYDSGAYNRIINFYDGNYVLFDKKNNVNRFLEFADRKDTYELLRKYEI